MNDAEQALAAAPEDQEEARKDRWFNPYRIPRTERARAIVADVAHQLVTFERRNGLRKRERRPSDRETFHRIVSALVCDMMYHSLVAEPEQGLVVTRSRRILGRNSRYRPAAYSTTLPTIVDRLASPEMDFLRVEAGDQGYFSQARQSCIWPGSRLLNRMDEHGIELDDLGLSDHEETVLLRRRRADQWDTAELIEYADTEVTRRFRAEMTSINRCLQEADIEFDDLALQEPRSVDSLDRRLRRCFTQGRFDCGGRLFGGFWQGVRKRERLRGILIDGEGVTSLDYSQMAARLLYGYAGVLPPSKDAYVLPGLEAHREGVKRLFNTLLFAEKDPERFPKGTKDLFPRGWRVDGVIAALKELHAPIAAYFGTGIGHELQFAESEILVDVLCQLQEQGVVALPVHDALVVKVSAAETTRIVMESTFKRHSGVPGVVTEED